MESARDFFELLFVEIPVSVKNIDGVFLSVIGVVINSITCLRVLLFVVQGWDVVRVTKHPPGRTNFANDDDDFCNDDNDFCIFVSSTTNPSFSEMSSVINRNSSVLFKIKTTNEVVFVFAFIVLLVRDTVSNSCSIVPVIDPPLTLPFDDIFIVGSKMIVSELSFTIPLLVSSLLTDVDGATNEYDLMLLLLPLLSTVSSDWNL